MALLNFSEFDDKRFTEFCNELLYQVISPGVTPFAAPGSDLGRDACFEGQSNYLGLAGKFVFQDKYHDISVGGHASGRKYLKREMTKDTATIIRNFPETDHIIFITNVLSTSHFQKWIDEELKPKYPDVRIELWDGAKLASVLGALPDLHDKYFKDMSAAIREMSRKLDEIYKQGATERQAPTISQLNEIRDGLNRAYPMFRFEVRTGIGEPHAHPDALAYEAVHASGEPSASYVMIEVFEKQIGSGEPLKVQMSVSFDFPDTEAGNLARQELVNMYERGTPANIPGEFVKSFDTNLPRILSADESTRMDILTIFPSTPEVEIPVKLRSVSTDGDMLATFDYITLRIQRTGSKETEISNEQQDTPLHVRFIVHEDGGGEVDFRFRPPGHKASIVSAAAAFTQSLSAASKIELVDLRTHERSGTVTQVPATPQLNETFLEFIEMLGQIEHAFGKSITFPEYDKVSSDDILLLKDITENILKTGRSEQVGSSLRIKVFCDRLIEMLEAQEFDNKMYIGKFQETVSLFGGEVALDLGEFYIELSTEVFSQINLEEIRQQCAGKTDNLISLTLDLTNSDSDITKVYLRYADGKDKSPFSL